MRRLWLLVLAGLLSPALSFAQNPVGIPVLTIKENGKSKPLELLDLSVSVEVEGTLVETVYELEFFNHTSRRQEGEFSIQLPVEATVSTYALDIQGHMRPGVAVEKHKARNAYESIKRRQVDPGLVEREAGNIYRTRIFPLEPRKAKRVRIGFVHRLPKGGKYVLPLVHKDSVNQFTCTVRGSKDAPTLSGDAFPAPNEIQPGVWQWQGADTALDSKLEVQSGTPGVWPYTRIETQNDGTTHFVVQGALTPEERASKKKEPWKSARVIWDASFSGRWRNQKTDFAALTEIWKWIGDGSVTVQILTSKLSAPRQFELQGGDGKAIEAYLKSFPFDGIADFSQLTREEGPTLLISDGVASSPIWMPNPANQLNDFYLLSSATDTVASEIMAVGVHWLNLTSPSWFDILKDAGNSVQVAGLPEAEWDVTTSESGYIVSGRIRKEVRDKVRIIAPGQPPLDISSVGPDRFSDDWNLARRIWAQRRLATLEWGRDPNKIIEFAEKERLVSDYTSLIVLEEFSDHIRYQIPPPEPELLDRYHRELNEKKNTHHTRIISNWKRKLNWYETRFPWLDAELETEVATVGIWVKSSHAAFPPDKQNNEALAPFEKWLTQAEEIIQSKETLKTGADFQSWKEQLDQSLMDLGKIRMSGKEPREGEPVHVSVRGFVRERGIYSGKTPYHLRQSVIDAGGANYFGSLTRVYLYHNAQRTGYNLESLKARPVPLRWGDMVVVESDPPDYLGHGFADPFADPFSAAAQTAVGGGPAVFEEPGTRKRTNSGTSADPFGGTPPKEAKQTEEVAMSGAFLDWEAPTSKGLDTDAVEALKTSDDPARHYQKLLSGEFGQGAVSIATNIEFARVFYEKDLDDLGFQALSNLCEIQTNPIEATRSFAYWLAELGQKNRAVGILKKLVTLAPDEATQSLVHFDIGRISGDANAFRNAVDSELRSDAATSLSTIALTDYFARGGESDGSLSVFEKNGMPADVRIVITMMGDTVAPRFHEPNLPQTVVASGSRELRHDRVHEFLLRRAWLGSYKTSVVRWNVDNTPVTMHADYYIRWNSDEEKKLSKTFLMDGTKLDLDGIEFGWE